MPFIADLIARGLVQDIMPGTEEQFEKELTSAYIGFDPTADSLHVGSLLPITLLMRLQRAGHKPYALVGGATGMIGDPSGKSAERNLLDEATLQRNCDGIHAQLQRFLDFGDRPNAAVMVNNYDWLGSYTFLNFIRDIGKHISVNYMLAKDSVQKRLETGLSFTEFTYQLIQGYDFYYLAKEQNVKVQLGGADQWGNMVTGTELIRRKGGGDAFALTCPLVTKSDGSKFGKTESGTIWLDAKRTSPYQFYQFWLRMSDEDAVKMSYTFSFRSVEEIAEQVKAHHEAPHQRMLQKLLAEEMTVLVHSAEALERAQRASSILFGKATVEMVRGLDESELLEALEGVPRVTGDVSQLTEGANLISFLADSGVLASKGEARKLIQNGGLSLNKEKVSEVEFLIREEHLLNGKYLLVQKGKAYTLAVFG